MTWPRFPGFAQNGRDTGSGRPPPSLPEQMPPGRRSQLNTESKEAPQLLPGLITQVSSNSGGRKFERLSQGGRDREPPGGQTKTSPTARNCQAGGEPACRLPAQSYFRSPRTPLRGLAAALCPLKGRAGEGVGLGSSPRPGIRGPASWRGGGQRWDLILFRTSPPQQTHTHSLSTELGTCKKCKLNV